MNIAQVEAFFFKAMMNGYVAAGKIIKVPEMPGYRATRFRDSDFYLYNCWSEVPNSPKSTGTTTIWYKDVPVWVMNYGGLYQESAIAFLKQALRKNYTAHKFMGGRGPRFYDIGPLTYLNNPYSNHFDRFKGKERIYDGSSDVELGYHEYWGMSLL